MPREVHPHKKSEISREHHFDLIHGKSDVVQLEKRTQNLLSKRSLKDVANTSTSSNVLHQSESKNKSVRSSPINTQYFSTSR